MPNPTPSPEAVEALPQVDLTLLSERLREYVPPDVPNPVADNIAGQNRRQYKSDLLAAIAALEALPIELEKARARWEAEVREWLEAEVERRFASAKSTRAVERVNGWKEVLDTIFEKGE